MIEQVLRDYLSGIRRERHFDAPFELLLPTLGFYDIHFTHGVVEFGKDFIAKRMERDQEIQCSFQLKKGDIGLSEWRDEVQNQMIQSVLTPLRHPNFDRNLPHHAYLVATGHISTPAAQAIDELNTQIIDFYQRIPIKVWTQNNLVDSFAEKGLSGLYSVTAEGFSEYGAFFQLYSQALSSEVTIDAIENYSRHWTQESDNAERWALWCAVECEVLAQQCLRVGQVYEAVYLYLCRIRALCAATYAYPTASHSTTFEYSLRRIVELCVRYVEDFAGAWGDQNDLLASSVSPTDFISYPVQCARFAEMASLISFLSDDEEQKTHAADLLEQFVLHEPGCAHPISDRYAVSLVVISLTLLSVGREEPVRQLLEQATIWLCDRYEIGSGLATVDSDEQEEIETLLGYMFEFTRVVERQTSFCMTAICDLSVLLADSSLYLDILNDTEACQIIGEYYQARDTKGACLIEAEDVVFYPAVQYASELRNWDECDFATHIADEPRDFQFVQKFGPKTAIVLSVVLRDRYFPRLWRQLIDTRREAST